MSSSNTLFDALLKFFNGRSFPLWIQMLASISQLDILIKASKSLAGFTARVRKADSTRNPLLRRLADLDLLDRWAIDLVKIVAKFSTALLLNPRAIYGLVSPFSPESSALYQQPHCKSERELWVTGGADVSWTDRLARISLPQGFEAYKFACAGHHIAILGANGQTMLWNSETFTVGQTIEHGEPATCITFNAQGDKLVIHGLQTTKIWTVPSAEIMYSVDNLEEIRAITLSFTNADKRVLGGFDDRTVRFFDVDELKWQFVHPNLFKEPLGTDSAANSPTCVAFSKNGLYAGVAYRGFPLSIWSMESGQCINRCNRAQGNATFAAGKYSEGWYVAWRFVWNPVTDHIIGFYTDGFVFKWHPHSGEHHEVRAFANDVVASSDRKLFLSSTSTGMIKVWDFEDFTVIYQLSSDDLLLGLAFSPNCQRFYDLRVGMVNSLDAWEPNSLLRFSDAEAQINDIASDIAPSISVALASEAYVPQFEAITALAACPNGKFVCVGTDDGTVELYSVPDAEIIEVSKFNNFMEISLLTWSPDAQHLVAVDLSGDISVHNIQASQTLESTRVVALMVPKLDLREHVIHEVVFNADSTMLLVVTNHSSYVWSFTENKTLASQRLPEGRLRKWLCHPAQSHLLLGIGVEDVRVFDWNDLHEFQIPVRYEDIHQLLHDGFTRPDIEPALHPVTQGLTETNITHQGPNWTLLRAGVTQSKTHILIRLSSTESFLGAGKVILFPLSQLLSVGTTGQSKIMVIQTVNIPSTISSRVNIALGVLPGNRFVFIDNELWICSCALEDMHEQHRSSVASTSSLARRTESCFDEVVQRHYFIPDDWAMGGSLDLCALNVDGTLLYPRDDKVSMIKASLHAGGFRRSSAAF